MVNPRVTYGVWIDGDGWLKREKRTNDKPGDREFATDSLITAERVAAFWGQGAVVLPIDDSLIDLEKLFLERRAPKVRKWTELWLRVRYGLL